MPDDLPQEMDQLEARFISHWWDGAFPRVVNVPGPNSLYHCRVQMRLIPDTGTGGTATDVANAKILASCGNDWYATPNSTGTTLPGLGIARFRSNTWSPPVPTRPLT